MLSAGAVGFSDDGVTVMNSALMREALTLSAEYKFPVMVHCEEHNLNAGAVMNLGETSRKLKPYRESECCRRYNLSARDIIVSWINRWTHSYTSMLALAGAVDLVRCGKQKGVNVTAEACPHHLDSHRWRGRKNRGRMQRCILHCVHKKILMLVLEGLKDGTIDAITTWPCNPIHPRKRHLVWWIAPNGIIGLETSLPIVMSTLVEKGTYFLERCNCQNDLHSCKYRRNDRVHSMWPFESSRCPLGVAWLHVLGYWCNILHFYIRAHPCEERVTTS